MKKFVICLVALTSVSGAAYGESHDEWILREKARVSEDRVNAASNSSFDKRLPPVIPGEELNDGKKRSKVWSTGGSYPKEGNSYEERPHHHGDGLNGIGVVVDGRGNAAAIPPSPAQPAPDGQ